MPSHKLLWSFICLNLIKNSLIERAMACEKFVRHFQILQKKKKNSDIKTSKMLKNIKESKDSLSRNY